MPWHNLPASALVHRPLPSSSRRSWRSLRDGFSKCPATARKDIKVFHIRGKTPFCREVQHPCAPPVVHLGACLTPKQLSRKHGETCCRYGFSRAQFQYETSHWYFVLRCNSYQPRCCRGGLELYDFRQTRLPQKDIFFLSCSYFDYPWPATLLDLTVDNVAGPPLKLILVLRDF